jgi:predicted transcriptional regulator of viral defense system
MIHSVGYNIDISDILYHTVAMPSVSETQQERAIALLKKQGMVRLAEFKEAGITAATVSRMKEKGLILQLSRGLYQLPDASIDTHHALAEAAKLVPKGIVCLTSALAFHGLTDTIPSRVWMAIGPKDRRPRAETPPLQFVRFGAKVLTSGIKEHMIERVRVRVYNPAKTVVDLFRYRRSAGKRYQKSPGLNLALEGLREALRQRKATPAEIARYANEADIWKVVQPYLDAMTANA